MLGLLLFSNVPNPLDDGTVPIMAVVRVTHALSPYTASAGQTIVVDSSGGAVVIQLPTLSSGQFVQVQQDSHTAFTNTITVTGSPGLDQPPPSNGTFVSSFVFGPGTTWAPPAALGIDLTWYNGGSAGGYLLE